MPAALSLADLFTRYGDALQLSWRQGRPTGSTACLPGAGPHPWIEAAAPRARAPILIGTPASVAAALPNLTYASAQIQPCLLILAQTPSHAAPLPTGLPESLAVMSSPQSVLSIQRYLEHTLAQTLSECSTVHGVLMNVWGSGVLLCGKSGSGKSELALDLIHRGHRFIVDDAVTLYPSGIAELTGTCAPILADFLDVHGLGVLDIAALFGPHALLPSQSLQLCFNLVEDHEFTSPRLSAPLTYRKIGGIQVPEWPVSVRPGKHLAMWIEIAVRHFQLMQHGHDNATRLSQRQRRAMHGEST